MTEGKMGISRIYDNGVLGIVNTRSVLVFFLQIILCTFHQGMMFHSEYTLFL